MILLLVSVALCVTVCFLVAVLYFRRHQTETPVNVESCAETSEMPALVNAVITPPCVLVVDGSPTTRRAYSQLLERLSCDAEWATTTEEALRLVHFRPFDLILTELEGQDLDGIEICKEIREFQDERGSTPIVALIDDVPNQDLRHRYEAGISDILPKPVTLENLRRLIERYVVEPSAQSVAQGMSGIHRCQHD